MKAINVLLFLGALLLLMIFGQVFYEDHQTEDLAKLREKYSEKHQPSVDHSKLAALQREFAEPQDVTRACISCHTERHKEVMKTAHWNWEREAFIPGKGVTYAGKKNLINNFCIGIGGSEVSCTRCHTGYGWKDNTFDFSKEENIDCIACHDNSGQYAKDIDKAGYPFADVNLTDVAQHVGLPQRFNCGSCHFTGGGGNNVKHGDLEEAMIEATRNVDVHMGIDGMDMQCVACHEAENHQMLGKMYSVSSMNRNRATCEQCHGNTPHESSIINEHNIKVACQTCHIPIYAKVNATQLHWDWSTAGKMKDGEPYMEHDEDGNATYKSIKGSFTWGKNLKPDYCWFNGTADHYFLGDEVDTTHVIKMNTLNGEYADRDSKIIPIKVHTARQIYDCNLKTIIQPKLFSEEKGGGGYWKDFDWHIAAKMGMKEADEPYSGSYCFVNTVMYWPLNHMVSSADKAVSCNECHTRDNSRLASLTDFYMPGRNYSAAIDGLGLFLIIASLAGVVIHGVIRIVFHRKNMQEVK